VTHVWQLLKNKRATLVVSSVVSHCERIKPYAGLHTILGQFPPPASLAPAARGRG
jgi:hypothetical protein